MLTYRNSLSPLPFYSSITKQRRIIDDNASVYALHCGTNEILPFQIQIPKREETSLDVWLCDLDGNQIINLNSNMPGLSVYTGEEIDNYIIHDGNKLLRDVGLPIGFHYLKISDKYNTYYSEIFCVQLTMQDFIRIEYWNQTDLEMNNGNTKYFYQNGYRSFLYFNKFLTNPAYYISRSDENRDEVNYNLKTITNKTININMLGSEFICDSLRGIVLADYVVMTDDDEIYRINEVDASVSAFQNSEKYNNVSIQLYYHADIKRVGRAILQPDILNAIVVRGQLTTSNGAIAPGARVVSTTPLIIDTISNRDGFFSKVFYFTEEEYNAIVDNALVLTYYINGGEYQTSIALPTYDEAVRFGIDLSPSWPMVNITGAYSMLFRNDTGHIIEIRIPVPSSGYIDLGDGSDPFSFTSADGLMPIYLPDGTSLIRVFDYTDAVRFDSELVMDENYAFGKYLIEIVSWPSRLKDKFSLRNCYKLVKIPDTPIPLVESASSFERCFMDCSRLMEIPMRFFSNQKIQSVSLSNFCYQCEDLIYLPNDLLSYFPRVTSMQNAFYMCSMISEIPQGFFDNTGWTVTNCQMIFRECVNLETIPDGLFSNGFSGCDSFGHGFHDCKKLKSIPDRLFANISANNINLTNCFRGCSELTDIGENIFENTLVQDVSYLFASCISLASIPNGLFANQTGIASLHYTFSECTSLKDIPSDIFTGLTGVVAVNYTFNNCTSIEELPSKLFNGLPSRTYTATFRGCSSLRVVPEDLFYNGSLSECNTIHQLFSYCISIESIPANLFSGATSKLTTLTSCFDRTALKEIPVGLIDNMNLTTVNSCFRETDIESIPENLFALQPNLTSATYLFRDCKNLLSIPNNIFDKNKLITDFGNCFDNCLACKGSTPTGTDGIELWDRAGSTGYPSSIRGSSCFSDVRQLENFFDIPVAWGGSPSSSLLWAYPTINIDWDGNLVSNRIMLNTTTVTAFSTNEPNYVVINRNTVTSNDDNTVEIDVFANTSTQSRTIRIDAIAASGTIVSFNIIQEGRDPDVPIPEPVHEFTHNGIGTDNDQQISYYNADWNSMYVATSTIRAQVASTYGVGAALIHGRLEESNNFRLVFTPSENAGTTNRAISFIIRSGDMSIGEPFTVNFDKVE